MAYSDLPANLPKTPSTAHRLGLDALLGLLSGAGLLFFTVLALRLVPDPQEARPVEPASNALQPEPTRALQWERLRVAEVVQAPETFSEAVPGYVTVDERRAARVGAPLAGRVERVHVERGQRVERGAPLLTLSSSRLPELEADLQRTDNALALARAEDARVQSLVRERLTPAKEALSSRARLRQAELAHHSADSRLRALRLSETSDRGFVLRAQSPGTIVDKSVLPFQAVVPGETLLQIADLSAGVVVIADVFESELGTLRAGTAARIELLDASHDAIDARVTTVADVVDPARRTVQVRMHVSDPRLRVNQRVQVRLQRPLPPHSVEVPDTALLSNGDHHQVYILDDIGRYRPREVLPGWASTAGRVVILAGLHAGERVVEHAHLLESRRWEP